uniref:Uncharacterized protein n=1 Tax=Rhizophora mucronata TaxID=61149 RepID=A0A2P2PNF2_RHIMU
MHPVQKRRARKPQKATFRLLFSGMERTIFEIWFVTSKNLTIYN